MSKIRNIRIPDSDSESDSSDSETGLTSAAPDFDVFDREANPTKQPFDYYCVFDVEATCEENRKDWKNEVIEFPVVVIDSKTLQVVAEFQSYVRPVLNPTLTAFCTNLTGITQDVVDASPTFPQVLKNFESFMADNNLSHNNMRFVTDGPWDIRDFVRKQCNLSGIRPLPVYFKDYIDLRRLFKDIKRDTTVKANLNGMLSALGMEFVGRPHSGIDDTRNIARIALRLMEEGWIFE
ncbi:Eri3 protein-like protein [Obelidium mucronatum]|nr:Eri3 protein-like protein [Obelidium mucronatum]